MTFALLRSMARSFFPRLVLPSSVLLVACGTPTTTSIKTSPSPLPPPRVKETPRGGAHLVSASELCITAGRLRASAPADSANTFSVDIGGMRAFVGGGAASPDAAAEMSFTYGGPSSKTSPLSNGEIRRQIGLKLRAKDTCNVLYVMWRIEPTTGIFVSLKKNDGMSAHEECGDRGYKGVKPLRAKRLAEIQKGESHTMRAEMDRLGHLVVYADGEQAWEGQVPKETLDLEGPIGVRSDNGAFDFDLRVDDSAMQFAACPPKTKPKK